MFRLDKPIAIRMINDDEEVAELTKTSALCLPIAE